MITMGELPLPLQTSYADLVERSDLARMAEDFPATGTFYRQTQGGRDYWYFREASIGGKRAQRYVGPDTPELRHRIDEHRVEKGSYRERRRIVTALQRAGLRGPDPLTGKVLDALAKAGVFRMRAVVVGTVAYQTYSGLLGVLLPHRNAATADLDIAQFRTISVAVGDEVDAPFGEILKTVDPRFEPVPDTIDPRHATHYALGDAFRVDILVPNQGPDSDEPVALPSIRAEGQPLRFLDFLIYREIRAVALWGGGILINVPSPERYALHKLLVSRLRIQTRGSQTKAEKDLRPAADLLRVLSDQRPFELRDLWEEMNERGPKWRRYAVEATRLLEPDAREALLAAVGTDATGA